MEIKELKNYGVGFVGIMTDPDSMKRINKTISGEFRKELGLFTLLRLMWPMRKEAKRMKKRDWSKFTRSCVPQQFIDNILDSMAMVKVLSDRMGMEKASQAFFHVWDRAGYDMMKSEFPTAAQLKACGDSFNTFKEWWKAFDVANEQVGILEVEAVEDSPDVYACNVKYCIWNEIAKELGNAYLAYPSYCYMDTVLIPRLGAEAGWQYQRTGALAAGAPFCDLRFTRSQSAK